MSGTIPTKAQILPKSPGPPKAKGTLLWERSASGSLAPFDVQYNPTELSFDKQMQYAEIGIPGLDAPIQQFVRGQAEKLNLELFFDSTEEGTGLDAKSVTELTDKIFDLVRFDPKTHAPPIVTFHWNDQFPGSSVQAGNQRRNSFTGVVEGLKQKFTLFSPLGVPLRATLSLVLREYRSLDEQLEQLNLSSPDRTHHHVLERGQTLSSIATEYWNAPDDWRRIAEENGIEDPRRLVPGTFLSIPVLAP